MVLEILQPHLKQTWLTWNYSCCKPCEPQHDKTNNVAVRPAKTRIRLGIRPVWSEFSLSAWRNIESLATHWEHSKDSDQTGRMPRLICVFAGHTFILLVLSCRGSCKFHLPLLQRDKATIHCKLYISHRMTKPTKWLCAQRRLRSAWASPSLIRVLTVRSVGS